MSTARPFVVIRRLRMSDYGEVSLRRLVGILSAVSMRTRWRYLLVHLLASAIFRSVASIGVPFVACSPSTSLVLSDLVIAMTPDLPRLGGQITFTATGKMLQEVTEGWFGVDVSVNNEPFWSSGNLPICSLWAPNGCPAKDSTFIISQTVTVPTDSPGGAHLVTFKLLDPQSSCIACVAFTIDCNLELKKQRAGRLIIAPQYPQVVLMDGITLDNAVHDSRIIAAVNSHPSNAWKARPSSRFLGLTLRQLRSISSKSMRSNSVDNFSSEGTFPVHLPIPDVFQSFDTWGHICPNINLVRDQGACASSGAFSVVGSVADRMCIATAGAINEVLSPQDVVSCCGWSCAVKCQNDNPDSVLYYYVHQGVVLDSCLPYAIPSCQHSLPCPDVISPPVCTHTCSNNSDWQTSKRFGASSQAVPANIAAIQTEIMTNGPVVAVMTLYADLPSYISGIYRHTVGPYLGDLTVKLVGWGIEDGIRYWTAHASWGEKFGNNGRFNILAGADECGVESKVLSGLPKI